MRNAHDLSQVLAELDRAFATPPETGPAEGCGYCYREADLVALGGDPHLVPDDLAGRFVSECYDHFGVEQYGNLWRRLAPGSCGS